jgi:hypothetical protein
MSGSKVYAVVLYDQAAEELGRLVELWLKRGDMGCYLYAKKIDPNGPYFHMWLDHVGVDGRTFEAELQLPHQFVKAVFYSADVKHIGFV